MNDIAKEIQDKILEQVADQFNHRKYNKLNDEIQSLLKKLKSDGELKKIESLLFHDNVNIVTTVAAYFFFENEKKTLEALEKLKSRENFDPFVVNDLINRLKKGEIDFDY